MLGMYVPGKGKGKVSGKKLLRFTLKAVTREPLKLRFRDLLIIYFYNFHI